MADQSSTTYPDTGYGNPYINSLATGHGWINGPISYYFASGSVPELRMPSGDLGFTGQAWTDREKTAIQIAVDQLSAVCNIQFQEVATLAEADIAWGLVDLSTYGAVGMHEFPDGSYPDPTMGYFSPTDPSWANLTPGSWGYITTIHEIGHGIGLAHPHARGTAFPGVSGSNDTGLYGLNQGIWTMMTYIDGLDQVPSPTNDYGWEMTPMAFDIAALQAMYGANMSTNAGANMYVLPDVNDIGTGWSCIWDAGGLDTISNNGSALACTIDLRPAPLTGPNAGGFVSHADTIVGGFTIANGVIIERAIGGSGNDTLIGNATNNVLDGGLGADTMRGGVGDDTYIVDDLLDNVVELAAGGQDEVQSSITWTLGHNLERLTLTGSGAINGTGNGFNNTLRGNSGPNQLNGKVGNDVLIGGGGQDRLAGGTGADIFRFESVTDSLSGVANRDLIADFAGAAGDRIDLSAIDADTTTPGDQTFSYIAGATFSHTPGELRFTATLLTADVDGDGVADFALKIAGAQTFDPGWLVL